MGYLHVLKWILQLAPCFWAVFSSISFFRGFFSFSIIVYSQSTNTEWQSAAFRRIFRHDGKISPGWCTRPPPFTIPSIMYKDVVYARTERADTLPPFLLCPYMYSVVLILRSVHQVYGLDEGFHRQERGDLLQPTQGMQHRRWIRSSSKVVVELRVDRTVSQNFLT